MANTTSSILENKTCSDFHERCWDVIIVGTGMGGATIGRRLAEKGVSVLFLERGGIGHRSEQQGISDHILHPAARYTRGYWPTPIPAMVNNREESLLSTIGAGVGGTSVSTPRRSSAQSVMTSTTAASGHIRPGVGRLGTISSRPILPKSNASSKSMVVKTRLVARFTRRLKSRQICQ